MNLTFCRVLTAIAFMLAAIGPASAQNIDSAISQLISVGKVQEAQQLLNSTDPSINDKVFFIGRVLKAQRQYDKAIAVFREILARDPGYINARRELAHTFLLAGNFEVAEFHFKQLLEIDPSPQMQPVYRRYLQVIANNKPSGISGSFALVPSSNVNRGSSLSEFFDGFGNAQISEESKAKSGLGVQLGLSGYFRKTLDRRSRLTFNWALLGVKYKDRDFDKAIARLSATYERTTDWGKWAVTPYLRNDLARQDVEVDTETVSQFGIKTRAAGLQFAVQRKLSPRDTLTVSATGEARDYPVSDYQNGPVYNLSASFSRRVRPDLTYSVGLSADRSLPRLAHLKYDGLKASASVGKIWKSGLQTTLGLNIGTRDFYGDYIFRDYPRSDDFWGVSVSLFSPKLTIRGLAPRLTCSYTRNRSNIEFFVYDVQECQISLTRNF
jgi:hypothetical protein